MTIRYAELMGEITGLLLTSALDITERILVDRTTGRPHDAEGQRQILRDVLCLAETARERGQIVELPYQWPVPTWEEQTVHECRDVCSLA